MIIFREHSGNTVRPFCMSVFNGVNNFTFRINDIQCQGNAAIQAVCCTGHSGVVGPDGHLHLVEYPLIVDTILNE